MKRRISGRCAALSLVVVGVLGAAGCSTDGSKTNSAGQSTTTTGGTSDSSGSAGTTTSTSSSTGSSSASTTTDTAGQSGTGTSSSAPIPTYVPPSSGTDGSTNRPVTGGCVATDTDLAGAVTVYARASQPTVPIKVGAIRHASSDPAWARVTVTPANADTLDGFVAIAHCVGSQWRIIDTGTSGVGCTAEVPAAVRSDISLEC